MRTWLFVFLVACSDGGGGEVLPDATVPVDVLPSTEDRALDGTWEFGICGPNDRFKTTVSIVGDEMLWRTLWFRDTDTSCTAPFKVVNVTENYVAGDDAPLSVGAREIDIELAGTTMAPATADDADYWNTIAFCGYTNWSAGVARDVAGKTCSDGGVDDEYWLVGHTRYTIYRVIDGNQLRFGSSTSGSGTSDGTRPTQLSSGYYTRK